MQKIIFIFYVFLFVHQRLIAQRDSTVTDSLLMEQIEQQMQTTQQNNPQKGIISTNPNIGVIGDFQSHYISTGSRNFDMYLNEAEFVFQSVIDPYARADFFLSVGRNPVTGEFEPEIEEAYLTTLQSPARLQLKAGKFRETVGRINNVHPHALPFVDMPDVYVNYFGEEGLNDEGFSLSWLVPNNLFYQEIFLEATNGPSENASFQQSSGNAFLYLIHAKNFYDLTKNSTLELGFTGITGPNDSSLTTTILGADLTYKWKPLQLNTYKSFVWQTETFLSSKEITADSIIHSAGLYSFITYQLAKRWFLTGRFDYSNFPDSDKLFEQAYSLTFGWYATEFQKIELEGKFTTSNFSDDFYQGFFRWIYVIGAHGSHQY